MILSKTIEATDKKNALQSFIDKIFEDSIEDTYYIGSCSSTEVTSCFVEDGNPPSGTCNMMMRESHHVTYIILQIVNYMIKKKVCV